MTTTPAQTAPQAAETEQRLYRERLHQDRVLTES